MTGVTRGVSRVALATVGALALALLGPLAPARAAGAEITITSPANGALVVGPTSVAVSGTTDGPVAESVQLFRDGALVAEATCTSGGPTCVESILWDSRNLVDGVYALTVTLTAGGSVVATSLPVAVDVRDPLPSVSVTSPAPSSLLAGVVAVTAEALIDPPLQETATSLALLVDDVEVASVACPAENTCSETISWDATGEVGERVLSVRVTTSRGRSSTSAGVSVTLTDPPPSVVLTAPPVGSVVGVVPVSATASVPGTLTEFPASVVLLVDGLPAGDPFTCPVAERVCDATFSWDATGLVAPAVLSARVVTTRAREATSDVVSVTPENPVPTVSITAPTEGSSVVGVTEVAVSASVPAPLSELPSSVVLLVDGAPSGDPFTCPVDERDCAATFSWDATGLVAPVELSARVVTTRAREATSDVVTVTPENPVPTVSITAPTEGSSVVGVTEVAVSASVPAPLSELPSSVVLLVDGAPTGDPFTCPVDERVCAATFSWDATGIVAPVELSARVVTTRAREATSAAVTVSSQDPPPTVSVTSPTGGASVVGATDIEVSGSVAASLTETVTAIEVLVDGVPLGTVDCAPAGTVCSGSVQWDATGVTGPVALTAVLTTSRGRTATSDVVTVTPDNPPPTVSIASPADGAAVVGVTEVAVSASVPAPLSELPSSVVLLVDGVATGDPVACLGGRDCLATFSWDATGLPESPVQLSARVVTNRGREAVTVAPVTVTPSNPVPQVGITAPAPGATIVGRTTVSVTASTDVRLTEHPTAITVRDGSTVIGTVTCGSARVCSGSVVWDATLLAGARTLRATVSTDLRASVASSAAVPVTVANPRPTVVITAPAASAVVSGTSSAVTVTAATDLRRSDVPRTLVLRVDGVTRATASCTGSAHSCTRTLRWNAAAYAGPQVLTVALTTSAGVTVVSAGRTVFAASDARVSIARLRVVDHRAPTVVRGRVLATTTGEPVADARVRVVLDPARGDTRVLTVRTDSAGRYSVTLRPTSRTSVAVRVLPNRWLGPAQARATLDVRAPLRCSVDTRVLAPGEAGTGRCVVAGLPVGTPLALTYVTGGRTVTFARGVSRATTIPFSFLFPAPGTYSLQIVVARTSVYARTASPLIPVTVR